MPACGGGGSIENGPRAFVCESVISCSPWLAPFGSTGRPGRGRPDGRAPYTCGIQVSQDRRGPLLHDGAALFARDRRQGWGWDAAYLVLRVVHVERLHAARSRLKQRVRREERGSRPRRSGCRVVDDEGLRYLLRLLSPIGDRGPTSSAYTAIAFVYFGCGAQRDPGRLIR